MIDSSNNTVAQRIDYDSWGNITLDTNPGFQPFGFAGGEKWDTQSFLLIRFHAPRAEYKSVV